MKPQARKFSFKKKFLIPIILVLLALSAIFVLVPYFTFIYYSPTVKDGHLYFPPQYYLGRNIAILKDQTASLLPNPGKKFTSHLIDFSLIFPPNYLLKSESKNNYEFLSAAKDNENYLSITIFPISQGCVDTEAAALANRRWDPLRVKIAGKYPMTFEHGSISHGDAGHVYKGVAKANENYCIAVTLSINLMNEKEFANLIEGK